jgi:Xaa-Pro aminopeptidase
MNSRGTALKVSYTPIIGSGNNANVLHYIENNQQCKSGDLILIDAGAEYANYSSDMTRTIPFQENTMTDKSRLQCRFTR